jgi:hypothetical protein
MGTFLLLWAFSFILVEKLTFTMRGFTLQRGLCLFGSKVTTYHFDPFFLHVHPTLFIAALQSYYQ